MNTKPYLNALEAHFGTDETRIRHSLKVLGHATDIAEKENLDADTRRLVYLAALYHDVGIKPAEEKYGSAAAPYQEKEGAPVAREILRHLGEPQDVIERVAYIVGSHHTRSAIDGIDFQVIWEADLLVNIDEQGMADRPDIAEIIEKNFVTATGRELARRLYLRET